MSTSSVSTLSLRLDIRDSSLGRTRYGSWGVTQNKDRGVRLSRSRRSVPGENELLPGKKMSQWGPGDLGVLSLETTTPTTPETHGSFPEVKTDT